MNSYAVPLATELTTTQQQPLSATTKASQKPLRAFKRTVVTPETMELLTYIPAIAYASFYSAKFIKQTTKNSQISEKLAHVGLSTDHLKSEQTCEQKLQKANASSINSTALSYTSEFFTPASTAMNGYNTPSSIYNFNVDYELAKAEDYSSHNLYTSLRNLQNSEFKHSIFTNTTELSPNNSLLFADPQSKMLMSAPNTQVNALPNQEALKNISAYSPANSSSSTLMAPSFKDPYKLVPIDGSQNTSSSANTHDKLSENTAQQSSALQNAVSDSTLNSPSYPVYPDNQGVHQNLYDQNYTNNFDSMDNAYPPASSVFPNNSNVNYYPNKAYVDAYPNEALAITDTLAQLLPAPRPLMPYPQTQNNQFTLEQAFISGFPTVQEPQNVLPYPDPLEFIDAEPLLPNVNSQVPIGAVHLTKDGLKTLDLPQCTGAPNSWTQCANFTYHNKNQIYIAEPFVNGQINGFALMFSKSGQLQTLTTMKDNAKNGSAITYYPNGSIMRISQFANDQLKGIEYYYYENGALKRRINYVNGLRQGLVVAFYQNGQAMFEANYHQGKISGNSSKYYIDGTLAEEVPYFQGLSQGLARQFYPNGNLRAEADFVKGKLHGQLKNYSEDGTLYSVCDFVNNLPHGFFTEFYPNGQVYRKSIYVQGRLDGISQIFNQQGNLEQEIPYQNGQICGKVKTYYQNGTVKEIATYMRNVPHGPFVSFTKQGKPWRELHFVQAVPQGIAWLSNPQGERYVRLNFLHGRLTQAQCMINSRSLTKAEVSALLNENIMPRCP